MPSKIYGGTADLALASAKFPRVSAISGGGFSPLSFGSALACWYSPLFAPFGANVTEVTGAAGTGTVTQVGTAITGVGTQFVKECKIGDAISGTLISGNVVSITSATAMTVDASNSGAGAAFTITPISGVSARVNRVFDQSGQGRHVDQATRSKMGGLRNNVYAGKPAFDCDGADDLWVNATAFLTGTEGAVFSTWIMPSGTIPNAGQRLISSGDEGTNLRFWYVGSYGNNALPNAIVGQSENDTPDVLTGDTTILAATRINSAHWSTGSAYGMSINGVAQVLTVFSGANTGNWWDSTTLKDNVALASIKRLAELDWFRGYLLDLFVITRNPTVADFANVAAYQNAYWP